MIDLHEEMLDLLPGLGRHAVDDDQAVAMLGVALQAQEADGLLLRETLGFPKVEQCFRLIEMSPEDALERLEIA